MHLYFRALLHNSGQMMTGDYQFCIKKHGTVIIILSSNDCKGQNSPVFS